VSWLSAPIRDIGGAAVALSALALLEPIAVAVHL